MWRLIFCFLPLSLLAQGPGGGFGNMRVVGAAGPGPNCLFCGGTQIDAYSGINNVTTFTSQRDIGGNAANASTIDGKLLFYTTGWTVMDKNGNVIPNGNNFSPTPNSLQSNLQFGDNFPQNSFIFQNSEDSSTYTMLHTTKYWYLDDGNISVWKSTFKVNTDSSISVIEKNVTIINDTVDFNAIAGCKHANGRDWWVIIKEFNSFNHYTLLFTPDSIYINTQLVAGSLKKTQGGGTRFSSNGNFMATYNNSNGLRIYNFNRCNGQLSLLSYIEDPQNGGVLGGGLCFSPENKYLYFNSFDRIYRVPLQSNLSNADVELVRDYTLFVDTAFGFNVFFQYIEPSLDGKLYVGSTNGSRFYCTIDHPDAADIADIGFNYFTYQIPYFNNHTYTNHANYTLGPLAGSPCDTLGLGKNDWLNVNIASEIFPNPNEGSFTINYSPQAISGMLFIYDISGHLIFKEYVAPWSNTKNINLAHKLNDGMYAINLEFGNKRGIKKFVVKNE
jgi:hypothetical protein